jgi:hypothetical protein
MQHGALYEPLSDPHKARDIMRIAASVCAFHGVGAILYAAYAASDTTSLSGAAVGAGPTG